MLAVAVTVEAQQAQKVYRIGYLSPRLGIEAPENEFRQALRELGYSEGQNLLIEWRFTKGKTDVFPEIAAELVRRKLDCIVAIGVTAIGVLKQVTETTPIVMGTIDADPIQQGYVKSLARPGGNVTGLTGMSYDIAGKRLELLKEIIPRASRMGILVDPSLAAEAHVREAERAAGGSSYSCSKCEMRATWKKRFSLRGIRG